MTGRTPTPTKLKELQGTARKDRVISNEMDPPAVSLPSAPDWMSEYARQEWFIVTAELEALGILTNLDLSLLSMYCEHVSDYRRAREQLNQNYDLVVETPNGALQPNPLLGIMNKASDIALKIAGQFGFTPAARTRIGTPQKPEEDEFDKWLRSAGR